MTSMLSPAQSLPRDAERATLIGRLWLPDVGPVLVAVHEGGLHDLSRIAPTASHLLELDDPVGAVRQALRDDRTPRVASLEATLANSDENRRDAQHPWLLAPCDLQAVKASGVTFVASLLERVIEEQARGDAAKAESSAPSSRRHRRQPRGIMPGSERPSGQGVLIAQDVWSQYLEVGIGPDAEIFTKAPADVRGRHRRRDRHPCGIGLEQPRAGSRAGREQPRAARSAPRSATTSTCATSRAAARCCSARPRTTTRPARSGRSFVCSTRASASTTCAASRRDARGRAGRASRWRHRARCRRSAAIRWTSSPRPSGPTTSTRMG